jgi:hypothetical protein
MVEAPKQSEIQNVLAMDDPQQMVAKLLWEIRELTTAMSVWVDNEEFPVPIFMAFNAIVTAGTSRIGCGNRTRSVVGF